MSTLSNRQSTAFLKQLWKLQKESGLSPTAFADFIGIPASTIRRWKNGRLPSPETIQKIEEHLQVLYIDLDQQHAAVARFIAPLVS